jgi:glycerate 2-kinase
MNILIAPNAFKNSLSAEDAAEAIRQGLLESGLLCSTQSFPVGDGGDGTALLLIKKANGVFKTTRAKDPMGRIIDTSLGYIDNGATAVIEMANISGLRLLENRERDPVHASSYGTGELIRIALNDGARKIVLGIGGTATVDGGCGILHALGFRFLDVTKKELIPVAENLVRLDSIDESAIDKKIWNTELLVLCDVDNYLLGEKGAAAVFGPQKGASENDVILLENALRKLADVTFRQTGKDMNEIRHGGAAGGTAAALHIFLNARLVQGIEYFLDNTGFDEALKSANLLITGEGSIDLQTLTGKAPFGVARRAKKKNIPVIGLAGIIPDAINVPLLDYFDIIMSINHPQEDIQSSILHASVNLRHTAWQIGKRLASDPRISNIIT